MSLKTDVAEEQVENRVSCFRCFKYHDAAKVNPVPCCKCEVAHCKCLIDFTETYNSAVCHYCGEGYVTNIDQESIWLRPFKFRVPVRHAKSCLQWTYAVDTILILFVTLVTSLYLAKALLWLDLDSTDIQIGDVMHIRFEPGPSDLILAPISWLVFIPTALLIAFLLRAIVRTVSSCTLGRAYRELNT